MTETSVLPDHHDPVTDAERVPLLRSLSEDVRRLVTASLEPVRYSFGEVIVREGDAGDAFYILLTGNVRVLKQGDSGEEIPLNLLGPGDCFGEVSLLKEAPRTATVRACGPVQGVRLDRAVFQGLVRSHPSVREQVARSVELHQLRDFVRLSSAFATLTPAVVGQIVERLEPLEVAARATIFREGEYPDGLYLIHEGRVRLSRRRGAGRDDVAFRRAGDIFGEASLVRAARHSATAEAVSGCKLLRLPAEAFARLCAEHDDFQAFVRDRMASYQYRGRALVPLDFAQEILPGTAATADAETAPTASPVRPAESSEVEVEPAQWPVRVRTRIRHIPQVWQLDETECGVACLSMVCRHYGRAVGRADVRGAVGLSAEGSSLLGLVRGAERLGLAARAVKVSKERLDDVPLPAIVHWQRNHWVVLYAVDRRRVRVADPASGPRRLDRAEFCSRWTGYAALLERTPSLDEVPETRSSFGWVRDLFRPHRAQVAYATAFAAASAGLLVFIPIFSKVLIDKVVPETKDGRVIGPVPPANRSLLAILIVALAAASVGMVLASVVQRFILSRAAVQIDADSINHLNRRLLALPLGYFGARRTGDIERRLLGLREIRQFVVESGIQAVTAVAQLVVVVTVMLLSTVLLTGIWALGVPFYLALMWLAVKKLRPLFSELEESFGRYQSRQIDAIRGIETVKATGAEEGLRHGLTQQFHDLAERVFHADRHVAVHEGAVRAVTLLTLTVLLWVGAGEVLDGRMALGSLVAFSGFVGLANAPLGYLLGLWDRMQVSRVLVERLGDIIEQEPEQAADSALVSVRALEGRVRVEGLCFSYDETSYNNAVDGVSLSIEAGESVAIVGRSGSGKTTLAKCIAGMLEPTAGAVLHDGVDVREIEHRTLRQHIGFVLQDTYLFDDTIAANIALGDDQPDQARIVAAAQKAYAREFIERLPLGYETRMGEAGVRLSGGQRQRIAIARALYRDPPLLILDEANSSLDAESERALHGLLSGTGQRRTSLIIAQRLSSIRDADRIVVLERGRVVEQGTHEELMEREGYYYYLAGQQLAL